MEVDEDVICADRIKPRRIKPQNLLQRLMMRESGLYRRGTEETITKEFYQNVYPNLTVVNVEKPPGFLRKFSPDGKYLIGFSYDQTSVEIYSFQGTPAAAPLLNNWKSDLIPNTAAGGKVRSRIFDTLFRLKHRVMLSPPNKQLNRECSLFTRDAKFVIVGASNIIHEDNRPSFYDIYTTNEAITPNSRIGLEDYTLYLINIEEGVVTDSIDFNVDRIFLSHNQGIYLYNNIFAVISIFHQTIHIYELYSGKFNPLQKLGRFCCELERNLYNATYPSSHHRPFKEATIGSLKHRVLVYLFNEARKKQEIDGDNFELRKFYQFFDQYKNLRMWKMQLIDENHILIKYASEEVVSLKVNEPSNHPSFFIFFNIPECKVLGVFDNTSRHLLHLFEIFTDKFRNAHLQPGNPYPCSPSNNVHADLLLQRCKQTIISARGGGILEATKRLLAQLPISAQSYSCSPYLDLNLFSYDDKWISVMERPKNCGEYPIRFFERDSGIFKFRIYPGLQDRPTSNPSRRLVAFTFHPTEPFAISVQRANNDYVVNFHIRNESTCTIQNLYYNSHDNYVANNAVDER